MKKNLLVIHLLRYLGIFLFLAGFALIFLNEKFSWGVPFPAFMLLGLVAIILMASANTEDFGYPTTVDIAGIPVPPLRDKDTTYTSNGFIVNATKNIPGSKDPDRSK